MSTTLDNNTVVAILTATKKTGKRNYYEEYPISVDIVKSILIENGYPHHHIDDLPGYAIDLAGTAVFIHKINCKTKCNFNSCMKTFIDNKIDKITDNSWNKAIDHIVNMLNNKSF